MRTLLAVTDRYRQNNKHFQDSDEGQPQQSKFRRKKLMCAVGAVLGVVTLLSSSTYAIGDDHIPVAKKQPNIIMIVLDDTGFADLGAFGSEIKTPNIDLLAYSGLRYNRFDTSAISAPTRAALITGRNNQTVNMEELPPLNQKAPDASIAPGSGPATSGEIPLNAQTVAQALHTAGYKTFALGKWHLAPEYNDNFERTKLFMPKQRGFDYFYGFLSGHTDQYHPKLVENNTPLKSPDDPDYHFLKDIVDHAISAISEKSTQPKFVYLAFGAAHSPLQVPKPYIDSYKGKYAQGWDQLRLDRFARQKKLGIIPADTKLPPREYGDAAWDTLNAQQKRVYSRFMETYAGYLTHTDEQIGRLIQKLKSTGQYDDTLIMLITDNGAASEGGPNGGFRTAYMDKTTVADMDAHLDEAGGPKTDMLYQRPWAYAGTTPFRRYKLWPFLGGVRTPLIVSWPSHIQKKGMIRHQYVSVVDIAPTILDAAGTKFASTINGESQIPVAGQSFLATFNSDTARTRDTQYFELRGQRAITHGKWRAIAMHKPDTDFADDRWMLFDTENDFSESTDLADKYPAKVEEMKKLWWEEAKRNSQPAVIAPNEFLYKFNRMDNAFGHD